MQYVVAGGYEEMGKLRCAEHSAFCREAKAKWRKLIECRISNNEVLVFVIRYSAFGVRYFSAVLFQVGPEHPRCFFVPFH